MPNRLAREEWLDSDNINGLSPHAERFFLRLLLTCDDAGRCPARPDALRSRCFPISDVTEAEVAELLSELVAEEIVQLYEHAGKRFFQIMRVQRAGKTLRSKYPDKRGSYDIEYVRVQCRDAREFVASSLPDPISTGYPPDGAWVASHVDEVEPHVDGVASHVDGGATGSSTIPAEPPLSLSLSETLSNKDTVAHAPDAVRQTRKRKAPVTDMPGDFAISDRVRRWAEERGFDSLDAHLESFKRYVARSGKRYSSWDDALISAIADDWGKIRSSPAPAGQRPAIAEPRPKSLSEFTV